MSDVGVAFEGSLDMESVERVQDMVLTAAAGHSRVVADCTQLEFIDSTGVRGLITLKQRLEGEGKTLELMNLKQDIIDILDILGIKEMLVSN